MRGLRGGLMPTRMMLSRATVLLLCVFTMACDLRGGLQGTVVDPPKELPVFEFTRANGETFRTAPEAGRPTVVLFGYTHCPDVCPTTLADWSRIKTRLGADAARVRFLFVSVDPDRDTPQISQEYASRFDPSFIGVTGDTATIGQMQRAFGVASFHEHAPGVATTAPDSASPPPPYMVNHTTATFLLDDKGRLVSVHSFGGGWHQLAENLERLL